MSRKAPLPLLRTEGRIWDRFEKLRKYNVSDAFSSKGKEKFFFSVIQDLYDTPIWSELQKEYIGFHVAWNLGFLLSEAFEGHPEFEKLMAGRTFRNPLA